MAKDIDQQVTDEPRTLSQDVSVEDSLDDASRRALLARVARVGAAAVPVSLVLMDQAKAQNIGGSPGFGG